MQYRAIRPTDIAARNFFVEYCSAPAAITKGTIGIGGGIGWVMLLNVWGVIWRIQKRLIQWTRENATNGTPIPEKAKAMARQAFLASRANAFLSVVMLFFMGAASHYPMFGK